MPDIHANAPPKSWARPFRMRRFGSFHTESTFACTRPALSALYETLVHWFNPNWTAILRTPMIFEAEYGTCIFAVLTHQQEYTKSTGLRQTKSEHPPRIYKKKGPHSPVALRRQSSAQNLWVPIKAPSKQ
jgi:hypothetical protein